MLREILFYVRLVAWLQEIFDDNQCKLIFAVLGRAGVLVWEYWISWNWIGLLLIFLCSLRLLSWFSFFGYGVAWCCAFVCFVTETGDSWTSLAIFRFCSGELTRMNSSQIRIITYIMEITILVIYFENDGFLMVTYCSAHRFIDISCWWFKFHHGLILSDQWSCQDLQSESWHNCGCKLVSHSKSFIRLIVKLWC